MTNRPEGDARAERNQRRAAARERAQRARVQQKRRQRGVRIGLQVGLGVVLLAAVTVVTLVLVDSTKPAGPGPSSMSRGGITIGQDLKAVSGAASSSPSASSTDSAEPVRITMYVDYLCPECAAFEKTNRTYIEGLVDSGVATVDIHPVATLSNRSQGTKYSLRAANAAACVAQSSPDAFWAVNRALFAAQPEQGTAGLTDAQLQRTIDRVDGVRDTGTINACIDDQRYGKWVDERTSAVTGGDVPGTTLTEFPGVPLVLVNGQRYEYSQPFTNEEFRTFVITAAGADDETATPTPTPTRTRTPTASPSASASAS
ncbi:thioredoxin domain-containing protein [Curtobacterium sp. MCLR17_007]|uniref:DsbA family protein n=1 Tax=Curtobacterium sp. MCLR17_007 TaxID=2175648 RepID=UPI000DA9F009|nr:thioredoxin domain-containing protein [Curtobacterium sp. MCLR17_007]WIB59835.1 thioredoxin domain-containing protein [Curtobacterium sp. MCLR17_007]